MDFIWANTPSLLFENFQFPDSTEHPLNPSQFLYFPFKMPNLLGTKPSWVQFLLDSLPLQQYITY
jgi:hypothetical protein